MNGKEKIIPCPVWLMQQHYDALLRAETTLADMVDAAVSLRGLLMRSEELSTSRTAGLFGVFEAAIGSALEEVEGVTRSMQLQMRGEGAR